MARSVWVVDSEWQPVLQAELAAEFPGSVTRVLSPGWMQLDASEPAVLGIPAAPCIAFARQVLPAATDIAADSIRLWAQAAVEQILVTLKDHAGPWRLHVFAVPVPGGTAGWRRAELIEAAILDLLKQKARRLLKLKVSDPLSGWESNEALVQVGLRTASEGFLSVLPAAARWQWRRCLSPVAGGVVQIEPDKTAPSRAFGKLIEAQLISGWKIEPGQTCVDLGCTPGGWTYVAVGRGASVIAVDRSPPVPELLQHRRVTFEKGDAFAFVPQQPVDWLLCDVIGAPAKTLAMLTEWLQNRWCRRFCVTVKFKGPAGYGELAGFKSLLAAQASDFIVRRLSENKNEATVIGCCD